jgi:hypothetical protein
MGDLMIGTLLPQLPREIRAHMQALEVVVQVADGIS